MAATDIGRVTSGSDCKTAAEWIGQTNLEVARRNVPEPAGRHTFIAPIPDAARAAATARIMRNSEARSYPLHEDAADGGLL